ncbi:DUF805 domain-containing protein [Microbacterium rhizosphaerae]|uniref:DUF805 domain-containing protein n=1 Tax=Microbacterium rhizosphaerae TaxID=1678237 RepID=A0ABZ0SJJ6_9MICO|nr:DUF805 domain-containing protein [Microbacterium rhizosphaerae]WPR88279.1 DUF805 domain-containing protein [Microbacterium rhizosphaerae]
MTFPQSISTVFRKYADFTGTASRAEFWWWILFTALVNAALSTLSVWNVSVHSTFPVGPNLTGLWAIAVLVPTLAVTVRRLRSADRSWANLFWLLLPVAGLIILIVLCAQPDRVGTRAHPAASTPL